MQLFKKKAYTTVTEEALILPIDFILTKACSGSDLTNIILDDITGGVGPYYPATDTFTSEALALANTSWSATSNPGSVAVYYPETAVGTYWVVVKDSVDDIFAKEIFADCFDPETADRHQISVGNNTRTTEDGLFDAPSTSYAWIATRIVNTASVGDVIFTTPISGGSIRYDGYNNIDSASQWRRYVSGSLFNSSSCLGDPCFISEAIIIGSDGVVGQFGCCAPPC